MWIYLAVLAVALAAWIGFFFSGGSRVLLTIAIVLAVGTAAVYAAARLHRRTAVCTITGHRSYDTSNGTAYHVPTRECGELTADKGKYSRLEDGRAYRLRLSGGRWGVVSRVIRIDGQVPR
jgi:hypothetical protein